MGGCFYLWNHQLHPLSPAPLCNLPSWWVRHIWHPRNPSPHKAHLAGRRVVDGINLYPNPKLENNGFFGNQPKMVRLIAGACNIFWILHGKVELFNVDDMALRSSKPDVFFSWRGMFLGAILDYFYASIFHKQMCTQYSLVIGWSWMIRPSCQFITKKSTSDILDSIRNQCNHWAFNFEMHFSIIIIHYSLSLKQHIVFPSIYPFFLGGGVVSVSLSPTSMFLLSWPSLAQTLAVGFPTYPHRGWWWSWHQTQAGEWRIFGIPIYSKQTNGNLDNTPEKLIW